MKFMDDAHQKEKYMKHRSAFLVFTLSFVLAVMVSGAGSPVTAAGIFQSGSSSVEKQPFRSISPVEAKKLIDSRHDLVILDVRTPDELKKEGGIQGAVLVPLMAVMQNKLTVPKEKPILLVCAVGGRSYAAGQMLVRYGYQEVYNLSGGLDAWKKSGLPVVR